MSHEIKFLIFFQVILNLFKVLVNVDVLIFSLNSSHKNQVILSQYVVKCWFRYWINTYFIVKVKTSEQSFLRSSEVTEVLYILLLIYIFQICQNDIWMSMWINNIDFSQFNWTLTRSLVCLNSGWDIDKGLVQSQASSVLILWNFRWI